MSLLGYLHSPMAKIINPKTINYYIMFYIRRPRYKMLPKQFRSHFSTFHEWTALTIDFVFGQSQHCFIYHRGRWFENSTHKKIKILNLQIFDDCWLYGGIKWISTKIASYSFGGKALSESKYSCKMWSYIFKFFFILKHSTVV